MIDRMFARLRPDELDELAEASYRRRRADDLARAFTSSTQHPKQPIWRTFMSRRPLFLLATSGAVAAIAAGAITVSTGVLSGTPTGEHRVAAGSSSTGTTGGTGASPAATRVDARSFLLAAADTALRETATTGEYWYVRTRTASTTHHMPKEFQEEAGRLLEQEAAEYKRTGEDESKLDAINQKYNRKLAQLKKKYWPNGFPYTAYLVQTEETWRARRAGGTNRVLPSNPEIVFPTPEDEAKWKELGSPNLLPNRRPRAVDDTLPQPLSISNPDITMKNVGKLPTSKKQLADRLRKRFERLPDPDKEFPVYLWQTTVDLMTAPTTPGTRAALLKVLADQPGITSLGEVEDGVGRTGVGLAVKDAEGAEFTLVIDKDSAALLEYAVDSNDEDDNVLRVTYEDFGWTDRLGERPQG